MKASASILLLLLGGSLSAEETGITRLVDENGDRVPTHTVVPVYPEDARRDRIEGEVQVCYHVDVKGRPYSVAVRKSSHRIFERPSKRAVKSSMYVALEPGEKTSGIKTCRTFRFQLQPLVDDTLVDDS
jgi:TonB family protein